MTRKIHEEVIYPKCGHTKKEHFERGCNHARWGRSSDYPCMCLGFEEEMNK